jgi:NAD(P)-dependent dehydrogenase (short-subunit alcohol dehydrogenase family)
MSERFKSRTVVVTAAGSGIGAATARGFAREGARVVVADLSGKRAKETAAGIAAAGGQAVWIKMDAAEPGAVQATVQLALDRYGSIDVLVNNAGYGEPSLLADCSIEAWNRTLAVTLTSVFLGLKFDGVDVMQQSGELRTATASCRLSYAIQRGVHVIHPRRSAGHAQLDSIAIGSQPSLHRLRRRRDFPRSLVRQLLRYYAAIRLPAPVAHRRVPLGFTMRAAARLSRAAAAGRGISRFPCEMCPRVRGVSDRAGSVPASPMRQTRCGLRHVSTASAPRTPTDRCPGSSITRLDARPARTPVNASPTPSRMCTHDSGPP